MDSPRHLSRRRFLTSQCALTLAVLAGCAEGGDEDRPENEGQNTANEDADSTEAADLDLRESNVVDVAFENEDGAYTFDVALHHDDNGEEGYANWWQVERLDGTRLGRRKLLHAHSQQPFTRSETIEIPESVTCVVVRGHDQTHEYGGVAAVVNLDSGDTRARVSKAVVRCR